MAQYRSQWTGEVIDDAVGKAKNITYLTVGIDANDSYQKAGAAFGQSPLYARELLDGDERLYICTYRIDMFGLGYIYYFEYANGSASILWTLDSAQWSGPIKDSYPTIEYLSKSLGFYENSQTASRNYVKGQYIVWDVAYEYGNRLYVADVDIPAGTTLKKSGSNKNLTAAPNGGLNDLKSALTHDLANIVATGTTNTTGAVIASGTYFYFYDNLVQAIADIAVDAAFTLNTNYKTVTAGGLNDLKSAMLKYGSHTGTTDNYGQLMLPIDVDRIYGMMVSDRGNAFAVRAGASTRVVRIYAGNNASVTSDTLKMLTNMSVTVKYIFI